MFLKSAEIYHFRNYQKCSLELTSPISVFTGDNGQGKTSFLEALYCGLRGKSFHPFISFQFVQSQKNKARIYLTLKENEGLSTLDALFFLTESGLKKEILYCGKKTTPLFLIKKFPSFVFTESSVKCIRQGPDQRRAFVDEMLCIGKQKQIKEEFNQILKQKKAFLKNMQREQPFSRETYGTLKALNYKFLQSSFCLVQERLKLLEKLFSSLEILKKDFFKEPVPELSFSYNFLDHKNLKSDTDIFLFLEEDLKQKEKLEIQKGIPFCGPQKHDICFLFNGEDSRTFCSKGEQRTFVLSLLGCYIQNFPTAFLFLDDVLLELDEEAQNKFLKFLEKNDCQTFLTNCKVISFKTKKMSFFSVKNGRIKRYD